MADPEREAHWPRPGPGGKEATRTKTSGQQHASLGSCTALCKATNTCCPHRLHGPHSVCPVIRGRGRVPGTARTPLGALAAEAQAAPQRSLQSTQGKAGGGELRRLPWSPGVSSRLLEGSVGQGWETGRGHRMWPKKAGLGGLLVGRCQEELLRSREGWAASLG